MLDAQQVEHYRREGHLTVPAMFDAERVRAAVDDLQVWGEQTLSQLDETQEAWYLETDAGEHRVLRKLDNPVLHRPVFRELAADRNLVAVVEQLIGHGVSVFFSQVFLKPPRHGGPKPIHQDGYYFGPSDAEAMITVWLALDDANEENGCLSYGQGSHTSGVFEHRAPASQPFNLQVSAEITDRYTMSPAPVPRGGISLHHGQTLHQSSSNRSSAARRAVAMHYLQNDAHLAQPALEYDPAWVVKIS